MKKVLIFGVSGFVGRYLVDNLLNHGYEVIGTDCLPAEQGVLMRLNMFECVDILNARAIYQLIEKHKPDYIVNLAAISSVASSWKIPQKTIDVNLNGTLNILEAVRKIKFNTKILLIGSSEEYEISDKQISEEHLINANNPYGISKVAQENFAKIYREEYGLKIINTRTFNHTGIGQSEKFVIPSFVKQVAEIEKSGTSGVISVGNLSARRDLGDVRDMVEAYRMLLENESEYNIFNVGSGTSYLLEDILNYIISLSNQTVEICVDADRIRPLDNPIIWCKNSRIRKEIGWEPKYTIYDTINEMYQNYLKK